MSAPAAAQPPAETRAQRNGSASEAATTPEPPKLRRRPMLIALSVLLTALGALLGAWLLTGLSGTESYIAVREDVPRGAQIQADDLVRTQLRTDSAVRPLLWDEQRAVIGRYASKDLAAGSVVTRDSVAAQVVPVAGQSIVGLALEPGQVQVTDLKVGDQVRMILLEEQDIGSSGQPEEVSGTVTRVGSTQDGSTRLVDVSIQATSAATVAPYAANRQIALVLDSSQDSSGTTPSAGTSPTTGTSPSGSATTPSS